MTGADESWLLGLVASTTVTVKVKLPARFGFPLITPVFDNLRPLGSRPEVTFQ